MWQLKPEIVAALEKNDLTGIEYFPEEISNDDIAKLYEGAKKIVTINSYERNSEAKNTCKEHWGTQCIICGFDFEKKYAQIGKKYIHVHHLIPVAQIGRSYQIDPINDMRPVCPNCHAMLHKKNPPMTIDELKEMIQKIN